MFGKKSQKIMEIKTMRKNIIILAIILLLPIGSYSQDYDNAAKEAYDIIFWEVMIIDKLIELTANDKIVWSDSSGYCLYSEIIFPYRWDSHQVDTVYFNLFRKVNSYTYWDYMGTDNIETEVIIEFRLTITFKNADIFIEILQNKLIKTHKPKLETLYNAIRGITEKKKSNEKSDNLKLIWNGLIKIK